MKNMIIKVIGIVVTILLLSSSCYSPKMETYPAETEEKVTDNKATVNAKVTYTYEIHTLGGLCDTITVNRKLNIRYYNSTNVLIIEELGKEYYYIDHFKEIKK